jgi:penicillin-binding protein 1A
VLNALVETKKIDRTTRDAIAAYPVASYTRPRSDVVKDKITAGEAGTQYFVEYVRRQLADRFGDAQVNGGGLRVYTSLDLDLQRAAYESVYGGVLNQPGDPAGALVSIDTDGFVRAMVGGRDWNSTTDSFARVNFAVGKEGGGKGRQAGSSFKPFVLATAVADGFSVESAFDAPPKIVIPNANAGRDYTVSNYDNESFGRMNLVDATAHSVNTVYAQLIQALGPERVASIAQRLGVTSDVPPFMSITLGTPEVSVLEMADAYLTFATRGVHVEPNVIEKVTDADGNVLWEPARKTSRVMEEREADTVSYVLQQVVKRGTGTRARLDTPTAGKTGTTQSYGDAWFVGYTPGLSTAVWIGFPDGQEHELRGVHGLKGVTGGTLPAQIWHDYMDVATDDPRYRGDFVDPGDLAGRIIPSAGVEPIGGETTTTSSSTTSSSIPDESTTSSTTTTTRPPGSSTTSTIFDEQSTTTSSSTTTTAAPG